MKRRCMQCGKIAARKWRRCRKCKGRQLHAPGAQQYGTFVPVADESLLVSERVAERVAYKIAEIRKTVWWAKTIEPAFVIATRRNRNMSDWHPPTVAGVIRLRVEYERAGQHVPLLEAAHRESFQAKRDIMASHVIQRLRSRLG